MNLLPLPGEYKPRRRVYITDRADDGRLLGYLIAVDGEHHYDVELAPHLVVLPDDGLTRNGVIA